MEQDEQYLRLLSIFHYVVGGITALFASFPIIHLAIGLAMLLAPAEFKSRGEAPPAFIAWLMIIFASVFIALGWALAGCVIAAGRFLVARKHYMFCLIMAGIECILIPFGTVLGVFTIVVLMKESVQRLFSQP
jgi:hypothetical protein